MNIIKNKIKDNIYDFVELGVKGHAKIEMKNIITNKIDNETEKDNTISVWIAKTHEGFIRNQAYQGSGISFTDWFKTLVLCSNSLNINYNTKNINFYALDETGSKLKNYTNHPNVVGYCTNLTNAQETTSKSGIYDAVESNKGRYLNSTRRVFNFAASKANGTINSLFMTAGADPFSNYATFYPNNYSLNLPSTINDISFIPKVIGKLTNNNYILAGAIGTNYIYEVNPQTGYKVNTYTLPFSINANRLAIANNKLYYVSGESDSNGTITIKQATLTSTITFDLGTAIPIKKISSVWYFFKNIISDGTYLYCVHADNSQKFFITKIDNALSSVSYFDYLTNTINLYFDSWCIDPVDNCIEYNVLAYSDSGYAYGNIYIKYRATPSGVNEYLNLFSNSEQLGYSSNNDHFYGYYKYNNKYYSGYFKHEYFPNNFGSMLNLDTPIVKDANHSMTVTYDYTIL